MTNAKSSGRSVLESPFSVASEDSLERVDAIYQLHVLEKKDATVRDFREAIMDWYGSDFFDIYADWVEEGEKNG